MKTIKQCKTCPWRVNCVPKRDIPNYRPRLHVGLKKTIRSGLESLQGNRQIMACHYSKPDSEIACAGWLRNQIDEGNNLGMRLAVMNGEHPVPVVDGPQHATFEGTLCTPRRKRR